MRRFHSWWVCRWCSKMLLHDDAWLKLFFNNMGCDFFYNNRWVVNFNYGIFPVEIASISCLLLLASSYNTHHHAHNDAQTYNASNNSSHIWAGHHRVFVITITTIVKVVAVSVVVSCEVDKWIVAHRIVVGHKVIGIQRLVSADSHRVIIGIIINSGCGFGGVGVAVGRGVIHFFICGRTWGIRCRLVRACWVTRWFVWWTRAVNCFWVHLTYQNGDLNCEQYYFFVLFSA